MEILGVYTALTEAVSDIVTLVYKLFCLKTNKQTNLFSIKT